MSVQLALWPNLCCNIRLQGGKGDHYQGGKAQHVEYLLTRAYLQDTKSVDEKSAYQLESDGKGCAQSFAYFQIDPAPMHLPSVLACSVLGRRSNWLFLLSASLTRLWSCHQSVYPARISTLSLRAMAYSSRARRASKVIRVAIRWCILLLNSLGCVSVYCALMADQARAARG